MKKKQHIAILVVLALVFSLMAGCAGKEASGTVSNQTSTTHATDAANADAPAAPAENDTAFEFADTNHDGKVKIGFSAVSFADAWMVSSDEALKELCAEYGYEYTSQGAEGNSATQVNQLENMVTMGCDWIYAMIFDVDALEGACKKAEENNCHIIYIGNPFDDRDAFYCALTGSQYDFGYAVAELANKLVDEKYPDAAEGSIEAALFMNTTAEDFKFRADGMAEIEKLNPKVKIVETYDLVGQDAAAAKCQEYTDQLFMTHPNCKLILSHSSDFAIAIDEDIMRTPSLEPSSIAIFSDDWLEAAGQSVRASANNESTLRGFVASGDLNATVLKICSGELLPNADGTMNAELFSFTQENIEDAFAMFTK